MIKNSGPREDCPFHHLIDFLRVALLEQQLVVEGLVADSPLVEVLPLQQAEEAVSYTHLTLPTTPYV